jgi:predicted nucleic acid-binding protein
MKRVFMDTNVAIDFLTNRQPFAMDAARIFDLSDKGKVKIFIAAVSYKNIYYVLRRFLSGNVALKLLEELAAMTEIANVTDNVIRLSFKTDFKDYEDAIQYQTALSIPNLDFIVTRNTKDFRKSKLAVLNPSEALASLTDIA